MTPKQFLAIVGLVVVLASSAEAAKNVPLFELAFTPTESIALLGPTLAPALAGRELKIQVVDGREPPDRSVIGSRTDDDDKVHALKASNPVEAWAKQVMEKLASAWGLKVSLAASNVLEVKLNALEILETNQAVGASFESTVRLSGELRDSSGRSLWSATSGGTATRYGKKFSNANCNEVLSDGMVQGFSSLLSSAGSMAAPSIGNGSVAKTPPMTPVELLEELQKLRSEGFDDATLVSVVKQKTLVVPLGTDDLVAWKRAGLSEEIIRAAVELPVK